ncbi:MAG: choline/ethanolamine kinase family protein [Rhodospirillaceae bacterium]|nr:choline/ethanolamine kinase family protein [Rhodospirillaceae bacterium]
MSERLTSDRARALRIPLFAGADASLKLDRLGGLTNRNYRIDWRGKSYVLRIPGEGTSEYIDRKAEAQNARIASDADVNAPLAFFDPTDGAMVTGFIEGGITMNGERFKQRGRPARAAVALHRMHEFKQPFASRFELFAQIDAYLDLLRKKGATIPDGYDAVQKEAEKVRAALNANPAPLVPSHCDPLAENFLDTGDRMWVVDWEYAGNNDPMWDLGDVSVEAGFDESQDAEMMEAYFGGRPPADQYGRMVMYKAMCDLLWTLWGVIQHANQNPVDDFWAYATNRFGRCQRLMGDPDFSRHLDAVKHGR